MAARPMVDFNPDDEFRLRDYLARATVVIQMSRGKSIATSRLSLNNTLVSAFESLHSQLLSRREPRRDANGFKRHCLPGDVELTTWVRKMGNELAVHCTEGADEREFAIHWVEGEGAKRPESGIAMECLDEEQTISCVLPEGVDGRGKPDAVLAVLIREPKLQGATSGMHMLHSSTLSSHPRSESFRKRAAHRAITSTPKTPETPLTPFQAFSASGGSLGHTATMGLGRSMSFGATRAAAAVAPEGRVVGVMTLTRKSWGRAFVKEVVEVFGGFASFISAAVAPFDSPTAGAGEGNHGKSIGAPLEGILDQE